MRIYIYWYGGEFLLPRYKKSVGIKVGREKGATTRLICFAFYSYLFRFRISSDDDREYEFSNFT